MSYILSVIIGGNKMLKDPMTGMSRKQGTFTINCENII